MFAQSTGSGPGSCIILALPVAATLLLFWYSEKSCIVHDLSGDVRAVQIRIDTISPLMRNPFYPHSTSPDSVGPVEKDVGVLRGRKSGSRYLDIWMDDPVCIVSGLQKAAVPIEAKAK